MFLPGFMTEQDASQILLVRAIEEVDSHAFPSEKLEQALAAPAETMRPSSWFLTRARYLLDSVPHSYASILRLARWPKGWKIPIYALAFLLGLGTNYLGPAEKIPLLPNPIMALVAWNLLVYIVLLIFLLRAALKKARRTSPPKAGATKSDAGVAPAVVSSSQGEDAPAPLILRVLFPSLWIAIHKVTLRFHVTRKQASAFVKVARRFWVHWAKAAGPLLGARWKLLLHCNALLLTAGAVTGMYIRGVFLQYEVIWTSTFITDPNTVANWVDVIFAPAILLSRIAGRDLRDDIDIDRLMSPAGDPAAFWIHCFALTALMIIMVPRTLLAGLQWLRISRARGSIQIDFDDYFASLIRPQIAGLLAREIERAFQNFSESIANFVCNRLYDDLIVPELAQFRESGGRITDLRERIKARADEFREQLRVYAGTAVQQLETALALGLERIMSAVRQDFKLAPVTRQDLLGELEVLPRHEFDDSLTAIGADFTDAISVAVSASMAVALGTIAGGFGESLEVAIIVALFGTSGPVGFLIGAVAGLLVGAGAWWYGRERIIAHVENISLPATLVRMALWRSRFDNLIQEGRTQCHELVTARVIELLSPLGPQISNEVWTGIERLWNPTAHRTPGGRISIREYFDRTRR